MTLTRNRPLYLGLGCLLVALGLASRYYASMLPLFLARYAGDTLWATLVFAGIGLLAPQWSSFRVAVVALAACYAIEITQFYHAPWIDSLRNLPGVGLVLGYGFLWSDIACYTMGVALGALFERIVNSNVS
jgi:hypothetical protein